MYLHVTHDDKFLEPFFIKNEKVFIATENKYIIYSDAEKLKYIQESIPFAPYDSEAFWENIGDFSNYKAIVIHYLSKEMKDFVLKCPKDIPIIWIYWGADALDLSLMSDTLLESKTFEYHKNPPKAKDFIEKPVQSLKRIIKSAFKIKTKSQQDRFNASRKSILRINYIAHYLENEVNFVRDFYKCNPKWINFNYGTIDQIVEGSVKREISEDEYIILGNSAAVTNNHLDALITLKEKNYQGKIICPLSYSGKPEYIKIIIKIGKEKFGDRFVPLTDFMPMEKYNAIVSKASFIYMNHNRSQGGTSIWNALQNGTPVILASKNPLYKNLGNLGFEFLTMRDYKNNKFVKTINHQKNKELLNTYFGTEAVQKKYHNLFNLKYVN